MILLLFYRIEWKVCLEAPLRRQRNIVHLVPVFISVLVQCLQNDSCWLR